MPDVLRWHGDGLDPRVKLISITEGADFEIDLSGFDEPTPAFAVVDDVHAGARVLDGLVLDGRNRRAAFRSLAVGEFCIEIYHVRRDGSVELLPQAIPSTRYHRGHGRW